MKMVPRVDPLITSCSPKLITTGKVTMPATMPTAVSMPTTATASRGKRASRSR